MEAREVVAGDRFDRAGQPRTRATVRMVRSEDEHVLNARCKSVRVICLLRKVVEMPLLLALDFRHREDGVEDYVGKNAHRRGEISL